MIIGIDLGTTNSAAAFMDGDAPRLIPNALGEVLTPSVIGLDLSGELLVGRAAKELQVMHPRRCASVFKRHMGSQWSTYLDDQTYTAEQLSSLVLTSLKNDAESFFGSEIVDAVISVPAYFNEPQRKATLQAARMAGLIVRRILNEPTAAALAYGLHESQQDKVLAVIDLGGGTFDVSIADIFAGTLEIRASAGEIFLGGEDFTRTLAARVLETLGMYFERAELEAPQMVSRLMQQCELAKCKLSSSETADVRIPDMHGALSGSGRVVTIQRSQFQEWSQQTLARVELPIRRALGDARLRPSDLSEVVLVGGATRMPMFVERINDLLSTRTRCELNPDEVVALGAAVQAGLIAGDKALEDLVITDVAPFTLGVEISKQLGSVNRDGYYLPIIHRNTTIPASRVERVQTTQAGQKQVQVKVYQGENRRAEKNLLLGEFTVVGIPDGPAGQEVDVRFTYDLNGVLEVEATVVKTQLTARLLITRHAAGMSEAQLAKAVKAMQGLKTHPREEAPNRLAMRRAERVYQELPALERQYLSSLLDAFETALEGGDKEQITVYRTALDQFLDAWDLDPGRSSDESTSDE